MHLAATLLLALAAAPAADDRVGSIYQPDPGPRGLISDKIARRPGDLITILIVEEQDVSNEESADLLRSTNLDYRIQQFDIKPDAFDPLPSIGADSQDEFKGTANYKKKGSFETRLTAIVVDTLPNGNLVLSGRRELRVDRETKVIEFTGVVRRYDVLPDNTVRSEFVADARISYVGSGPLTDGTNRTGVGAFLHRVLQWLWPF